MARIQDIREFTDRIAEVVEELTYNADAYDNPCVHIYRDEDMTYQAELVEESTIPADNDREDYYCAAPFLTADNEVDYEYCEDIANNYIFIEH